jgi:folate-binding protein YgfZ
MARLFCQKESAPSHAHRLPVARDALRYDVVMMPVRATLLPSYGVVEVTGRGARAFLQGQLTNDLLGLERHPGMLAAACNRQGRVVAMMRLAAAGSSVLIVLRRDIAPLLVAQLSQFVLRAEVQFEDRGQSREVMGLLDAEPDARWSQATAAASGLALLVCSARRMLLTGPRAALAAAVAAVARTDPGDWERAAIADGEPLVHPDTSALWLPQMLNLDLLSAVSFSKGCYLGQEIVARAQHLGRIKRRMLRYVAPPGIAQHPGQPLFGGDERVAQVVGVSADATATHCLAVAELERCADLLGVLPHGSEFVPADLPYAIPPPEPAVVD